MAEWLGRLYENDVEGVGRTGTFLIVTSSSLACLGMRRSSGKGGLRHGRLRVTSGREGGFWDG